MHCGAGPYSAYYRWSDTELTEKVIDRTQNLAQQMGIPPTLNAVSDRAVFDR